MPTISPAEFARQKRLRRALLIASQIHGQSAATGRWATGYVLRDLAIDPDSGLASLIGQNELALGLLRELVRKDLLEERQSPDRPLHAGERFTLAHCEFRLTERGSRLLDELEPVDPQIDDLRVEVRP